MMSIKNILWILVNLLTFVLAIFWYFKNPDYEPVIVALAAIASMVASVFSLRGKGDEKDSSRNNSTKMEINAGRKSKNYQSSNDININNER